MARASGGAAYALFIAIALLPLIMLAAQALIALATQPGENIALLLPSPRRLLLFLKTLAYAAGVAIAAGALGGVAGLSAWFAPRPQRARQLALFLALAAVPPHHHAVAWTWIGQQLGGQAPSGWLMSAWVQTLAAVPLVFALTLLGAGFADQRLLEAARLLREDSAVIRHILWPAARPAAGAAAAIVFLLTLADYSVPSLFQVEVYSLEILAEFSASHSAVRAFWTSWPLLATALLLAAVAGWLVAAAQRSWRNSQPPEPWSRRLSGWRAGLLVGAEIFVWLSPAAVVAALTAQSLTGDWWQALRAAQAETIYTCGSCGLAALLCAPLALCLAWHIRQGIAAVWWAVILLPLALPPALQGIAFAAAWAKIAPRAWQGTDALVALALAGRFAPLAVLLCLAKALRLDVALLEAVAVLQPNALSGWWRVRLPLLAPGMVAGAAAVFALGLGDVAAALSVAPPGRSTLAIRIYNYLHYGASAQVAILCLATLLASIAAVFCALRPLVAPSAVESKACSN
ncbi:MAG: hypothetical protein N3A66_02955 [Planctomycetota bacterium]|nr:hypothetical protein [Planctomycetota bacterium]